MDAAKVARAFLHDAPRARHAPNNEWLAEYATVVDGLSDREAEALAVLEGLRQVHHLDAAVRGFRERLNWRTAGGATERRKSFRTAIGREAPETVEAVLAYAGGTRTRELVSRLCRALVEDAGLSYGETAELLRELGVDAAGTREWRRDRVRSRVKRERKRQ